MLFQQNLNGFLYKKRPQLSAYISYGVNLCTTIYFHFFCDVCKNLFLSKKRTSLTRFFSNINDKYEQMALCPNVLRLYFQVLLMSLNKFVQVKKLGNVSLNGR